jgi:hypothetical protein
MVVFSPAKVTRIYKIFDRWRWNLAQRSQMLWRGAQHDPGVRISQARMPFSPLLQNPRHLLGLQEPYGRDYGPCLSPRSAGRPMQSGRLAVGLCLGRP